jgi:Transcriptional regulator, AbiEi antitoxin/Protein of unknown function (DUF559)
MSDPPVEASHSGTEVQPARSAGRWQRVVRLAERQHGVVALRQLRTLGLSASGVRSRVARGYLHRVHRGVYAVGRPSLTWRGSLMAAVLAYGDGAVVSHRSAAALWGLRPSGEGYIELSVPRHGVRSRPGARVHCRAELGAMDVTIVDGIPCTSLARTVVDLTEVLTDRGMERVLEQAEVLRLFDARAVEDAMHRAKSRHGKSVPASLLQPTGMTLTASELEERFLELVRDAGLPDPETNAPMILPDGTAIRVDFLWRKWRLAVETDGHAFHRTRQSRERDARRDQLLRLAGFEPLRFTGRQVSQEPGWVRRTLVALASRADGERSGRAGPEAA